MVRLPAKPAVAVVFSVKVPPKLMVTPPVPKARVVAALSVREAPFLIVTAPVKVLVPVAEVMATEPLVPPPIVVVPVTPKVPDPTDNEAPSETERFPPMERPTPVVVVPPLMVKL